MLTNIIFNLLGVFVFLFLYWKKFKEDFPTSLIFSSAFYILTGIFLGIIISHFLFPSGWFWLAFVGASVALIISVFRFHLKLYETIESATISLLPWLSLVFFNNAVTTSLPTSFLATVFCVLLIILFLFLDSHYRSFTWYSSGKVGFSGLSILGIFFLARAILAIFPLNVISFVKVETFVSGIISLVLFFSVYKLSKQKV